MLFGCAHQTKLTKVCLEGHTYFNYQNKLALKVNDLGNPIKCTCINCELEFAKKMDKETEALVNSALNWLGPLDLGNAQRNWDLSSYKFKTHMSRQEWSKKNSKQFAQLGKILSRRPFDAQIRGNHGTVRFNADYEREAHLRDTVHMVKEEGKWKGISIITK